MTATAPCPGTAGPVTDRRMPDGVRVRLDRTVRHVPGGWLGGSPPRLLRLTDAGRTAWPALRDRGVSSPATAALARRLTDAGIANPVPPIAQVGPVTVIVPAFGRADVLDGCLAALAVTAPAASVVVVDDGSPQLPDATGRDGAAAVAAVARTHGARLLRRAVNGGPGAARNTGLLHARTELVAFVDSDCRPEPGWLEGLAAHLSDPLVVAAAPRIVPVDGSRGSAARYARVRGALDLGPEPARVQPRARVAYVPTATLLARRSALLAAARDGDVFDPLLRVGEDVDLVWRLTAAGGRVRYDPSVRVQHVEPGRWRDVLGRRYRYGTSAAALTRAHPQACVPLVLAPWPTAVVVLSTVGRPLWAAVATVGALVRTRHVLSAAGVSDPWASAGLTVRAIRDTGLGAGRYLTQFAAPALLIAAAVPGSRRRRWAAFAALAVPALAAWRPRRGGLDPARFALAVVADDVAYGGGVWSGCLRAGNLSALLPRPARSARPACRRRTA